MRDTQMLPPPQLPPDFKRPVSQQTQLPKPSPELPISPQQPAKKRKAFIIAAVVAVLAAIMLAVVAWYSAALSPVDQSKTDDVRVVVKEGQGVADIASMLKEASLIRSPLAFRIHSELSGQKASLQAGGYILQSSLSTPDIIEHMAQGVTDEFDVTIVPGQTLDDLRSSLAEDGFSAAGINTALSAQYDHPLLAQLPSNATLEGYIYPDTYRIAADGSVEDVFQRSFDEFERVVDEGNIRQAVKKHGLTLHQAIILASIIQKEVSNPDDQRRVAQVFLKRLDIDMPLGSDPTFVYAAERDGVEPSIDYDSPYNTRLHKGLPPGPIGNFNLSALQAVIKPASGDYLYFVSGDDGTTHFSKTLDEHETNVARYCTDLCN